MRELNYMLSQFIRKNLILVKACRSVFHPNAGREYFLSKNNSYRHRTNKKSPPREGPESPVNVRRHNRRLHFKRQHSDSLFKGHNTAVKRTAPFREYAKRSPAFQDI